MEVSNVNHENLRLYSFQNFYLSGIHAGIQTAHAIQELNNKYQEIEGADIPAQTRLKIWATIDKTIVVVNGGTQDTLESLYRKLHSFERSLFPYAYFEEDSGLNNSLTNVSIIVPKRVWSGEVLKNSWIKNLFSSKREKNQLKLEQFLARQIKKSKLMS